MMPVAFIVSVIVSSPVIVSPVVVSTRVIVMVVPTLAASLVADVAMESPRSAFICEQRIDDFVD